MRSLIESKQNDINIEGSPEDKVEIRLMVSSYAAKELIPLLEMLQSMGSMGASRTIKIEDWGKSSVFGFDGDGSSKIDKITAFVHKNQEK